MLLEPGNLQPGLKETLDMYSGRIAARAGSEEAEMEWEDEYPDLVTFLLSHLPFLPKPTSPLRCSPLRSTSQGSRLYGGGQTFLFHWSGGGEKLANKNYHHMHVQSCMGFTYITKDPNS